MLSYVILRRTRPEYVVFLVSTNFCKFFSCLEYYKHKILLFILEKLEPDLQCFYLINVIESEWFLQSFLPSWYILSLNQSSKAVMKTAFTSCHV